MRRIGSPAPLILTSIVLVLAAHVGSPADSGPGAVGATIHPTPDGEVERVRAHLGRALERLRSTTPAGLDRARRAARAETIRWLEAYRSAGVFPHNHVAPDRRVPVFVDPHGTPCAVGYLMLRSGERELVDEIVRTDNLVRIPELEGDARLVAWLDSRGITLDEAALIQPAYDGPPLGAVQETSRGPETVGVAIATAALVGGTALTGADRGGPWLDILLLGTTTGHAYLLFQDGAAWETVVNGMGLMASAATEVVRLTTVGDGGGLAADLAPYVAPGRNGTEIGFLLRR